MVAMPAAATEPQLLLPATAHSGVSASHSRWSTGNELIDGVLACDAGTKSSSIRSPCKALSTLVDAASSEDVYVLFAPS